MLFKDPLYFLQDWAKSKIKRRVQLSLIYFIKAKVKSSI